MSRPGSMWVRGLVRAPVQARVRGLAPGQERAPAWEQESVQESGQASGQVREQARAVE